MALMFYHFRDREGAEVDIVIERNTTEIVGVEVKVSASVSAKDFNGLRKLEAACGTAFRCGVVFYDGETSVPFGNNMYAIPIRSLWG